ncbi:hypothetical protein PFAG_03504 [Plasmodium falciparum Santa Lucia]|uniref:Uncharacterized protein n=3 Tax=Plasmodium falciparum TaxID=5833 RepID=A0A024W5G0_PLAFA|nr:hypothetical protein PFTANZ_03519 [Plasmodium falciparum Tanzania (2000708)]ETW42172.1 hypothetical protein PFNF135_03670 [Plasmodium falciparum NF135/5.C10]EUT83629.1 hypothetical protein PFAG_03504 [Plasmodium falciparum Santa Lucia]
MTYLFDKRVDMFTHIDLYINIHILEYFNLIIYKPVYIYIIKIIKYNPFKTLVVIYITYKKFISLFSLLIIQLGHFNIFRVISFYSGVNYSWSLKL